MTDNKKQNSDNANDNVVSIGRAAPVPASVTIASPEDFLAQATSLVSFENQHRETVKDSAKPAARVSGLTQLADRRNAVKLGGGTQTEEHSDVTPFPHDRGKPPSSRNK